MSKPIKLITKELLIKLPSIDEITIDNVTDTLLYIRYTLNDCEWYVAQLDKDESLFRGIKYENDVGTMVYWSLSDLISNEDYFGMRAERDISFSTTKISDMFMINTDEMTFRKKI